MEITAVLRMFATLGLLLGLLAGVLWAVRRFDLRLPGRAPASGRLQMMERLALDPKRSLVLIRRDDREHLLLLGPERPLTIESNIIAVASSIGCEGPPAPPTFASLLAATPDRRMRRRAKRSDDEGGEECVAG